MSAPDVVIARQIDSVGRSVGRLVAPSSCLVVEREDANEAGVNVRDDASEVLIDHDRLPFFAHPPCQLVDRYARLAFDRSPLVCESEQLARGREDEQSRSRRSWQDGKSLYRAIEGDLERQS